MFDGNFRKQVDAAVKPIGHNIKRLGITADMITATGIVMAVCAAVAIGAGYLNLGLLFLVLTGVPDLVDGVSGSVVQWFAEDNPEDWSQLDGSLTA